ncbi:MAG: sugar phosphate nucleotidyltransferase [Hyphomicrobiaceae bacterium]|nr:sugar phosphate nucleotidyltransferase [Hyphomicrobiaceae bacterium]
MKVVLFCGGLGTRIREYSETIPKPMIPIGNQPMLWHIMSYYAQYGHRDFVLCLGYKANTIKEFFLSNRPHSFADCVVSNGGAQVEVLGAPQEDWRVALIDTGVWRNIGERLWAVREHVEGEEMFLANYSDGLTDAPLPEVIDFFKKSGKTACFVAVHLPLSFHLADIGEGGRVNDMRTSHQADIWMNGGYFIFTPRIFEFMREGEELVVEPFKRLIEADELIAYRYEGFWRAMDTLKDKQVLEDLVESGKMPWRLPEPGQGRSLAGAGRR